MSARSGSGIGAESLHPTDVRAQRLTRVRAFSLTHPVAGSRACLDGDGEVRQGPAFQVREVERVQEGCGRFGADNGAGTALPAEAGHGISDVRQAESAVDHVKVQHRPHLIAGEDNVAGVEICVKPGAGKLVNDRQGKVSGQCRPPPVKEVQFWFGARPREHGAQASQLLLAVSPPSEQVRDRIVLHRLGGEAGPGSVDGRQTAGRVQQFYGAAVVVVVPGNEMGHHPQGCRAAFDTTLARLAGDNLRDRNSAAPQMVLKLKLEDDPVPVGIAPAPAQHVP